MYCWGFLCLKYILLFCVYEWFLERKCRSNANFYYMAPNVGLISSGIESPITKITENIGD